jgi:hypothetical protein
MRIAEKVLLVALITGIVLRFSLILIGEEITMLSLLILSGIYFALGFLLFNQIRLRDVTKKGTFEKLTITSIGIAVMAGIALSIVCVGALFRFMSLPGSGEMLMIGSISLIIASILAAIFKSVHSKLILTRTIPAAIIGIVLLFVSELSMVKFQYRNHPAYAEAYIKYHQNPKNEALRKEMQLEFYRMRLTEEEFKEYEQSQQ